MVVNTIKIEKILDLYQIFEESIYISGKKSQEQFYKELFANSWGIIIDDEFVKKATADEIAVFIEDLIEFRSKEITMIKPTPQVTLYFWFDEMALQLCFNILSGKNRKLPFNCNIHIVDSPYPIINQFLKKAYNNALYGNYHEFTFIEKGDPEFGKNRDYEVDPSSITIDVWKITLPWSEKSI